MLNLDNEIEFPLHKGDAVALVAKLREEIPVHKIDLALKEIVLNLAHRHEPRLVVQRRPNKIQSFHRLTLKGNVREELNCKKKYWSTTHKFGNLLSLFLWNENVKLHMPLLLLEEILRKTKLLVDADFCAYLKIWKTQNINKVEWVN